ncbi:MAG: SGNH/GDSL hydrolase family protein [Rubrivivax sp.]|nr:MAG: SGNH/GDSL hydrolase family protein [Rubrivivax sp.]
MKRLIWAGLAGLALLLVITAWWLYRSSSAGAPAEGAVAASTFSLAILGDSDSHSYHDRVSFPASHAQRGGAFHDITWQWGEVLSQLRRPAIDLGPWGRTGTWWPVALVQDKLGWGGRAPVKEDFQYNFAQSGVGCDALIKGRMADRLVRVMDQEPARWTRGAVVIRIGINDFGTQEALQALSVNPGDPAVVGTMDHCLGQIQQAVALIHGHHPKAGIVLVGMFDNSHWARWTHLWRSKSEKDNIAHGLDHFDQALRELASKDRRLAFFDDRAWFDRQWGGRDEQGQPAYRPLKLGARYEVLNTEGDHPSHTTLADGHAGLVWNLLWAQSLVKLLNQSFDARLAEVSDAELVQWLDKHTAGRW